MMEKLKEGFEKHIEMKMKDGGFHSFQRRLELFLQEGGFHNIVKTVNDNYMKVAIKTKDDLVVFQVFLEDGKIFSYKHN